MGAFSVPCWQGTASRSRNNRSTQLGARCSAPANKRAPSRRERRRGRLAMINNTIARLSGYSSALAAPFTGCFRDGEASRGFRAWQIGEGVSALLLNGTTGEAPTLTAEEHRQLIRLAV